MNDANIPVDQGNVAISHGFIPKSEDRAIGLEATGGAAHRFLWTYLRWQPGNGGLCLHTIVRRENRMHLGISTGGHYLSGTADEGLPRPTTASGLGSCQIHCVTIGD